jgi:hypothetical protein
MPPEISTRARPSREPARTVAVMEGEHPVKAAAGCSRAEYERRRKYLDPTGDSAQNIQIGARQVTTSGPLTAARGQSRRRGTRGRSPDDPNAPRSPR